MSFPDNSPVIKPAALAAARRLQMPLSASLPVGLTRASVRAGTSIFSQGEPADLVVYVEEGRVQLKIVTPQGKEGIIAILNAGDFYGDDCLTGEAVRICTATCLTDSIIIRLDAASVRRAIRQEAAFAEFCLASLLKRNASLNDNLISQLTDSSERRLARLLLRLANCDAGSPQAHAIEHLDQEKLAQMVGTTRSRINYFMNRFRALGHIDYNGNITVRASLWTVIQRPREIGAANDAQDRNSGSSMRV
jgi:CRP/FNR family transcriptional regulator, cyclic AMP receptor protein